jgi:prevent-host-death family protein
MTKTVTVAEAKARLSEYIRSIEQGNSVIITRHGKPVAALVASIDLDTLNRLRAAGPSAGLASLAGGWEGSEELVEHLLAHRRGEPRQAPVLD